MKICRRVLFLLLYLSVAGTSLLGSEAFAASAVATAEAPIPGDRWMEIDLYWFERDDLQTSVNEFWDRFAPLYSGIAGDKGLILNVGWTVEYIMDWPGDLDSRIVLPTGSGEQPWVSETAPLNGDWKQMQDEWKARFANPVNVRRHGYQPWTYGDLRKLATAVRETAAKRGIANFKVGSLTYGWTNAYGEVAPWVKRHPEAFTSAKSTPPGTFDVGAIFDPGARLHADSPKLGGLPNGIPEGMPVHEAFAKQWGALSKTVGLDAIMLRDSFGMPVPYRRDGPFGPLAPSPEAAQRYNASVSVLVRETKQANPQALVMMYSNAASAVADWRSNCFDLESVAHEGFLDIFVDQTWAGAWNEVGVRHDNFWNSPTLGWTYQLAYMLMHSAILSDTKVRHYPLIETFDAWESWDVIHTVPQRLRWGIWAYSHASVKTPHGLKLPEGSYISWANQGKRLLSDMDVDFLTSNIGTAVKDAKHTTNVFGPTLVYSRETMQWQMEHAANNDIKEWVDEQAGSVIKWPLPVMSATRIEWLPEVQSDLFILQSPTHLSPQHTQFVLDAIQKGQAFAVFGSPADGVDPRIQSAAGLVGSGTASAVANYSATTSAEANSFAKNIPRAFPTNTQLGHNRVSAQAVALYSVDGIPALTINNKHREKVVAWDPPTFSDACCKSLVEIWGGSAAPYALTAGALNSLISTPELLHPASIDLDQAVNMTAWRTDDGFIHLMAAELEEGLRDDGDRSRHAEIQFPKAWKSQGLTDIWSTKKFGFSGGHVDLRLNHAESILLVFPE
jgi:hypothetical protein